MALDICYVLLSPTFGMHQYTADLANRAVEAGCRVTLVTTDCFPRDRYSSAVEVLTPIDTRTTGFSSEAVSLSHFRAVRRVLDGLHPDLFHFTGPHVWNVSLVRALTRRGLPVLHTLHDLDPHHGSAYGPLLYAWNSAITKSASHILVHGERYRERLERREDCAGRVTCTPLLHLFLGCAATESAGEGECAVSYEPWALFFGRLEPYKGVDDLVTACDMMNGHNRPNPSVVVAGPGRLEALWAGPLPPRLELRNHLIGDAEALELFSRCGLVVLPYVEASQSALIAAAYYFRKPVVVTRTGALPEYVKDGQTGHIVEPHYPTALARTLERMLSDRGALMRMGSSGRQWYESQRHEETGRLFTLYRQLAAQGTSMREGVR
jgi:glycosyltransferase involved in cell wall biosynthesis